LEQYLKTRNLLKISDSVEPCSAIDVQVTAYADYLRDVRGCARRTICGHVRTAKCFLTRLRKKIATAAGNRPQRPGGAHQEGWEAMQPRKSTERDCGTSRILAILGCRSGIARMVSRHVTCAYPPSMLSLVCGDTLPRPTRFSPANHRHSIQASRPKGRGIPGIRGNRGDSLRD
jgi:hypothetical protein